MSDRGHLPLSGCLLGLCAGIAAPMPAFGTAPCPPAAEVAGDMPLVEQIGKELTRRGISVSSEPASSCAAVHATVTEGDHTLHLTIDDAEGRRSERDIGSLDA